MEPSPNRSPYRIARRKGLTNRQEEILALVSKGLTNGEIADVLGISLDGVKWHVREVLDRLDVDSREAAAQWWRQQRKPTTRLSEAWHRAIGFGVLKASLTAGLAVGGAMAGLAGIGVLSEDEEEPPQSFAAATSPPKSNGCRPSDFTVRADSLDDAGSTRIAISRVNLDCELKGEYEVRLLGDGRQLPTDGAVLRANAVDLPRIYGDGPILLALGNWCGAEALEVQFVLNDGTSQTAPVTILPACRLPAPTSFRWSYARSSEPLTSTSPTIPDAVMTEGPGPTVPADQMAAMADGKVTWEENEEATASLIACLARGRVRPDIHPALGSQPTQVSFTISTLSEAPAAEAVWHACQTQFVSAVWPAYALQHP